MFHSSYNQVVEWSSWYDFGAADVQKFKLDANAFLLGVDRP